MATTLQLNMFETLAQTEATARRLPHWTHTAHGTRVQATYNPRIRCGWKCQTATGPVCECSCAGKHHGGRA